MTALLNQLSDARPTQTELEAMWPSADRAALLDRIGAKQDTRSSKHRYVAAIGLVAATATAFAVLPATVDPTSAAAADLRALALSAATYDGPVLEPGTWLHERVISEQHNSQAQSDGAIYARELETWTRWDGRMLRIERDPSLGWTEYDVLDGTHDIDDVNAPAVNDPASYQDPTPQFAATLPDSADELLAYLDGRVFGSSSKDEALYAALVALATSHTLPPETLAATLGALGQVDGVRTEEVRVQGRPAIEVSFRDAVSTSVDTMVVDEATGQALSTSSVSEMREYTSTTTLNEVVETVPGEITKAFDEHQEGIRYDESSAAHPN